VDINLPKEKAGPAASRDRANSNGNGGPAKSSKPKSRGFCFLMYENQLSTNLAVDNLNGAVVLGRTLRVDHCKNYKQLERNQEGKVVERDADLGERFNARPELHLPQIDPANSRPPLCDPADDLDPEDPMAAYLLRERQKRRKHQRHDDPLLSSHKKYKQKRRASETPEEHAARKDAKRIKKLLKEIGPSKARDHDRRDEEARESRRARSPRRADSGRHDARDRRSHASPRSDHDRYKARDDDRGYRRSERER